MADIELNIELLDGPEYSDFEYWDETSYFDGHHTNRWCHGAECYERRYRCRVPTRLIDDEEAVHEWIYSNLGLVTWLD